MFWKLLSVLFVLWVLSIHFYLPVAVTFILFGALVGAVTAVFVFPRTHIDSDPLFSRRVL